MTHHVGKWCDHHESGGIGAHRPTLSDNIIYLIYTLSHWEVGGIPHIFLKKNNKSSHSLTKKAND